MFDLFLSHNRAQKAWVRELTQFLRGLDLKVFFDEDSILPGRDFLVEIERAIETSRALALVISRASLRSKWVAYELALRLYQDPTANEKLLIPILTEPVRRDDLRLSLRRFDAVDLTNPDTRESEFLMFLRSLGVPDQKCAPMATWPQPIGIEDLHVADINSVIAAGWSGEELLRRFIEIDYRLFDKLEPAHEGDPEQWAPVFMSHPDTWRFLTTSDQEIVGYWHFVPLFEAEFSAAKAGQLLDSDITADKVSFFELPGFYDVYFVSIGIEPRYRRPKAVRQLFESIMKVVEDLAEHGVLIREVCANAYTPDGVALCRSLGMKWQVHHAARGEIYTSSMSEIVAAAPLASGRRIRELYPAVPAPGSE
jgi:hypothetical protein